MPRAKGARTGQKHQRALAALSSGNGPTKQPRSAALEVAATDSEAVATSPSNDDDFKTFQVVSRFIDSLVTQLENDEQKIEHALLWHEARKASAIACAEAFKRRSAINPLFNEERNEPFRLAWQQALREWETAHKEDVCAACSKKYSKDCHLARCMCYMDCCGCGQRVPARPWRVGMLSCRCEKISTIACRMFRSGIDS